MIVFTPLFVTIILSRLSYHDHFIMIVLSLLLCRGSFVTMFLTRSFYHDGLDTKICHSISLRSFCQDDAWEVNKTASLTAQCTRPPIWRNFLAFFPHLLLFYFRSKDVLYDDISNFGDECCYYSKWLSFMKGFKYDPMHSKLAYYKIGKTRHNLCFKYTCPSTVFA